ncbi:MAG: trypsin-like peptidase domain-containing protein [Thermoproteota archaeon]|jgi:S1-C subfamily serine protease|nr:trypsin-like peptidase domain-containing protein [Thermoproteota archaeon]MEE3213132.1 trypsin-like peptidase domain-containing protein [Thermoproteota archaeon]|tara:strand:+ start:5061 stop:6284 length:1224 start_codon:yes stop_codon:yes gene_type:complete
MANTGVAIGGGIATIAVVFAIFVLLNPTFDIPNTELIVSNGDHLETAGEITIDDVITSKESTSEILVNEVSVIETPYVEKNPEYSLIEIFERSEASVVQVNVRTDDGQTDLSNMGSGFVYSDDGYIITNNHVVDSAGKVTITFLDGESYIAQIIGTDADLDLAVLKIKPESTYLHPLTIGDSSTLKVGEQIAAIGNPFGLSGSMTAGIVSQIGRLLPQDSGYSIPDVIQTDAAINPGNSGGPLLNMKGEVVGINTAIQSATGEFTGVGFAVPSNTVKKVIPFLIEDGIFPHPWMGISGTDVDPELAKVRGLDSSKGFLVVTVVEGSPAEEAGLQGVTEENIIEIDGREFPTDGDIIIMIDDKVVRKISDLLIHLQREKSVGDELVMTINRDGTIIETTMVLGERPLS